LVVHQEARLFLKNLGFILGGMVGIATGEIAAPFLPRSRLFCNRAIAVFAFSGFPLLIPCMPQAVADVFDNRIE